MTEAHTGAEREAVLCAAFVQLADTWAADYDVIDRLAGLSHDCVALFNVDAAGLLLADGRGAPRVVASSTEDARLVEMFELQADEGPCLDCLRTSTAVLTADLEQARDRWPRFVPRTLAAGFHAVHAVPLRLREDTVGALNMFTVAPGDLPRADLHTAQALADVAAIGILRERAIRTQQTVTVQLQAALNSRVIIEQAKGILAERGNLDMAEAFTLLRAHARSTNQRLTDLAREIVTRTADTRAILEGGRSRGDQDPPR
ncbi:MAG TPA: GAF and ANTAR domain-containing protein [Pseudonocardia sp.]|jgi:transcriptional regulator with GAF, ATPase, and Fis domain